MLHKLRIALAVTLLAVTAGTVVPTAGFSRPLGP